MYRLGIAVLLRFATLVALLVLLGCGEQRDRATGQKQVTIRVAHFGGPAQTMIFDEIVEAWDKAHPDVTVKLERVPGGQYLTKLLTGIAANVAPDVAWVENHHMPALFLKGGLLPLNEFLAADSTINIKDYWAEEVERFTVDGQVYALPNDTAPVAPVFYNKKLFDQAGLEYPRDDWDWNDLLAKAQALTVRDEAGRVVQYGFLGWAWQSWILSMGGKLVDSVPRPTRCLMGSPEAVAGLRFFFDLRLKHEVMPSPTDVGQLGMNVVQLFMTGRLAMLNSGIWHSVEFAAIKDFDWDIAMFPRAPGQPCSYFATGGSGWGILKGTRHPKEAWEVVKLMGGPEVQKALAGTGSFQPAIISLAHDPTVWLKCPPKPCNKKLLNDAVPRAIYDPFVFNWNEISATVIGPELDKVWLGQQTVEQAVAKIVPRFNRLLQEEAERYPRR